MDLEKLDDPKKTKGKRATDPVNLSALVEAPEHLGVHAVERVNAKNGLVGAGVYITRVARSGLEVELTVGLHGPP